VPAAANSAVSSALSVTEPWSAWTACSARFEFEAASGGYTELQCGSYIFMERAELHETLAIG
jgi:hypothetical protein